MANIGTRVATVNIALSTSTNAALIERNMLQYTILSTKLHHRILNEPKLNVFTLSDVLSCLSIHCADRKWHPKSDFLTTFDSNTLQT